MILSGGGLAQLPGALVAGVAAAGPAYLLLRVLHSNAGRLGLQKTNYQGEPVTASMGIVFLIVFPPLFLLLPSVGICENNTGLAFAIVAVAAGVLGLIDDRFGNRAVGGFRGHFRALISGRMTTGALKALLLPAISGMVGLWILHFSLPGAALLSLLVSLGANTVNLLDVRPGRAVVGWNAMSAAAILAAGAASMPLVACVPSVAVYAPWDGQRRGMLGDVGSNLLGALVGMQLALGAPVVIQCVALAFLTSVQVVSERQSLSRVIREHWWLWWLDCLSDETIASYQHGE